MKDEYSRYEGVMESDFDSSELVRGGNTDYKIRKLFSSLASGHL